MTDVLPPFLPLSEAERQKLVTELRAANAYVTTKVYGRDGYEDTEFPMVFLRRDAEKLGVKTPKGGFKANIRKLKIPYPKHYFVSTGYIDPRKGGEPVPSYIMISVDALAYYRQHIDSVVGLEELETNEVDGLFPELVAEMIEAGAAADAHGKILLMELTEKRSRAGNRYMTGEIEGVQILAFAAKPRGDYDTAIWKIYTAPVSE